MTTSNDKTTKTLAEHLFREFYQEVFASLLLKFGIQHFDVVEDGLQESFYKALKSWNHDNYPAKPKSWLFSVARNHIINELKRASKKRGLIETDISQTVNVQSFLDRNENAQLQLLLACSKLKLKEDAKLIFTLKAISGFGVNEIARALLFSEENVYKKLQRAKRKLGMLPKDYFKLKQPPNYTKEDISYIESIVYFMFNEGYDTVNTSSRNVINKEICFEAVRLGHLLKSQTSEESTTHLLALCYFHMARFDTRTDALGQFISLRRQDRSKWDKVLIRIGFDHLTKPKEPNRYYIEALIASHHLSVKNFKATNWGEILKLYDLLITYNNSELIHLNRAICLFELGEKERGSNLLNNLREHLDENIYYSTSMAEYLEDKDLKLSKYWYKKSIENTKQDFRKQIIKNKLKNLE